MHSISHIYNVLLKYHNYTNLRAVALIDISPMILAGMDNSIPSVTNYVYSILKSV